MGAAVTSVNMPGQVTPIGNLPPVTVSTAAATTGSIFSKAMRFLSSEWAGDVGKACFDARQAGSATLTTFNWKGEYAKYFSNKAVAAAAPVAQGAAKAGLFSKLGALLGKAMPFLQIGVVAYESFLGYQAGGTPEALKAGGKSLASLAAFPVASALATALFGFTGLPVLIAGALGAFGVNMLLNKFFPPLSAPQSQSSSGKVASGPSKASGNGKSGKSWSGFDDPMIRQLQADIARRDKEAFLSDVDLSKYMYSR